MLDMKKVLAGATVVAGSLVSGQALAEASGSVNVTSEYMFRGIDSSGGAAVQGSLDWSSPTGVYAGTWASNSYTSAAGTGTAGLRGTTEVDLYLGWAGDMGNGLGVDLGVVYYLFPDADEDSAGTDIDYWEVYGGLSFGGLSASVYYTNDFFNQDDSNGAGQDGDGIYVTLAYTATIKEGLDMTFQVGNSSGDGVESFVGDSYTDWSITTSKDLGDGWGASFAYVQTDIDINGGLNDDAKAVVSLSKEFAL